MAHSLAHTLGHVTLFAAIANSSCFACINRPASAPHSCVTLTIAVLHTSLHALHDRCAVVTKGPLLCGATLRLAQHVWLTRHAARSSAARKTTTDLAIAKSRVEELERAEAVLRDAVATEADRRAAAEAEVERLLTSAALATERESALKRDLTRAVRAEAELRERVRVLERLVSQHMPTGSIKAFTYTEMASARVGSAPPTRGDGAVSSADVRGAGGNVCEVDGGDHVAPHATGTSHCVVPTPPRKPPPRKHTSRPRAEMLRRASSSLVPKLPGAVGDASSSGVGCSDGTNSISISSINNGTSNIGGGGGGGGGSDQRERVEQLPHFPEPVPPIRTTLSSPR